MIGGGSSTTGLQRCFALARQDPPPKDDTVVAVRPLRQLTFANSMPSEQCPKPFVIPLYIHTLDSHYRLVHDL